MGNIIQIKGSVKYSITLDPSVWIFDDRKIDLNTYFELASEDKPDELSQYKKIFLNNGTEKSPKVLQFRK